VVTNPLGRIAIGEDFFDRKTEQEHIWRLLKDGNNLLLLAPRRVGKSSLMKRLEEDAGHHAFLAAYVTVPDIPSEIHFLKRLADAICDLDGNLAPLFGRIHDFLANLTQIGPVKMKERPESPWIEFGNELIGIVRQCSSPLLLLVDELPIFVAFLMLQDGSGSRARQFLYWFRRLREETPARWLLAGSIGLDTVTRQAKLGDAINDLYPITEFGEFQPAVARSFLQELGKTYRIQLESRVLDEMLAAVGWAIPYHLCLLFEKLREHCGDHKITTPTLEDVEHAARLLVRKAILFDYWDQRLTKVFGPAVEERALAILSAAAVDPQGVTKDTLGQVMAAFVGDVREREREMSFLLDVLKRDGYLAQERGRYRFRSNILRQFWLENKF
jgi:hypothetical protein